MCCLPTPSGSSRGEKRDKFARGDRTAASWHIRHWTLSVLLLLMYGLLYSKEYTRESVTFTAVTTQAAVWTECFG